MLGQIVVSVVENDIREKVCFIIEVPLNEIRNEQYVDKMEALQLMDVEGWLRALADLMHEISERNKNG